MKVKEEHDKVGLQLNIQKTKIMSSCPITSWQIDGETVETVAEFIFLGSRISADGDCSNEIKRHLLLGRRVMTNLESILKSRDITLPTKVHLFKAMVFPVVMYGWESWTIKKAEWIARPGLMHDTRCLGPMNWDDPEGWYRWEGAFRMRNTCTPLVDSSWWMAKPIQYCKVISLQLK